MRLSLRTLLAFEDNVFDVEQHRRLEQLLPTDQAAEITLQRMRSVVRNPMLGVPGLVDQQEELDPNYVAEYLDHQMPSGVQEKFEAYCLSADKYLAEVASVHHILCNVLGEPARTSRECRLKCYEALPSKNKNRDSDTAASREQTKHFRPHEQQETTKPAPFWQRWFPQKPAPQAPVEPKKPSSLWTFTVIGLCVCALLLGWQQIEAKRTAQKLREMTEAATALISENAANEERVPEEQIAAANPTIDDTGKAPLIAPIDPWDRGFGDRGFGLQPPLPPLPPLEPIVPLEPIEQVAHTTEVPKPVETLIESPSAQPAVVLPMEDRTKDDSFTPESPSPSGNSPSGNSSGDNSSEDNLSGDIVETSERLPTEPDDTVIAFQPMTSSARIPSEAPVPQNPRPPLPATVWQPSETPAAPTAPAVPASLSAAMVQHPLPVPFSGHPLPQPITQTSGTAPRALGRVMPMIQPSVVFSAASSRDAWQLPALPFDLNGGQYLLTAAPFRGTFELAGSFQIEMIGDAKLCILPPDAAGVPGIFVDYGRIIIRPLQANQPLRIEMERSRGIVSVAGTETVLFIDTFAEISDPPGRVRLPEEQKTKTSPILGFVPKVGERIVWKSASQPHPFHVDTRGSMLLQSDQYRLGEIQNLPNWLGPMPMSLEDRLLAEACRRYFSEARGDGGKALTWMTQDESQAVRILGLRLWGDLGEFFVPLTIMAEKRAGDEAVRLVLGRYFEEVMRRDAESIQRFADAIDHVKETQRRAENARGAGRHH